MRLRLTSRSRTCSRSSTRASAQPQLQLRHGRPHHGRHRRRRGDRWNCLFIAGMWFQGPSSTTTSAALSSASSPTLRKKVRSAYLRVQHRRRLAQYHREDAHDLHPHQVVRGAWPSRDLRRRQEGQSGEGSKPRKLIVFNGEHVNSAANDTVPGIDIAIGLPRREDPGSATTRSSRTPENAKMAKLYLQGSSRRTGGQLRLHLPRRDPTAPAPAPKVEETVSGDWAAPAADALRLKPQRPPAMILLTTFRLATL